MSEFTVTLSFHDEDDARFRARHLRLAGEACAARAESLNPCHAANDIADQIEAQTRTPKPEEPTGLGAVVKDRDGERWVRHVQGPQGFPMRAVWRLSDTSRWREYADIDVVSADDILSEGV